MKLLQTDTSAKAKGSDPFFGKGGGEGLFASKTDTPFFGHKPIQRKLTVGAHNDRYEKEADAVADQVVQRMATGQAEQQVQRKPATASITPVVQAKCDHCEAEEKEEAEKEPKTAPGLMRKAAAGAPPDDPLQRKCTVCSEEEPLQRKENGAAQASPSIKTRLAATKGSGSPLPGDVSASMGQAIGADFSNVKIHTGTSAVQLNRDLNAQAFTHGNDIYFDQGKYDTGSKSGQHLLAHELTHTVQQGAAGNQVQRYSWEEFKGDASDAYNVASDTASSVGGAIADSKLKYASPAYWAYRAFSGYWSFAYDTGTSNMNSILNGRNDYFDIKGTTSYSPGWSILLYIRNYLKDYKTDRVPVKIKYGNMAKGTIILQVGANGALSTTGKFLMGIDHPAFQVDTAQKGVALEVEVTNNVISGSIGIPRGRTGDFMQENTDSPLISYGGFHEEDLYPVIFGEAYDGTNFMSAHYVNELTGMGIRFTIGGLLDIDHQQYIKSALAVVDNAYVWSGTIDTNITGTARYELPVERTPSGFLSAEADGIQLGGQWQGQGFSLNGALRIVYSKKSIEVYGKADYKSKRAEGSVNIAVAPEPRAQALFRQHAPAKQEEQQQTGQQAEDDANLDAPLALTAWGDFKLKLVDKTKKLTGSAAVAVSPEGYIVTAGLVKFNKDFILMDELNKEYILFEDEMNFPITLFGVPLDFSLRGDIRTGYKIGPVAMYEIIASGVYSNHPDYKSEICIGAKFEMPGNLYAALNLVAAAAIRVGYKWASVTIVEIGGRLNARADLNAYVNAMPSIGVKESADGTPEYCILGKLYAGGELVLSLDAGMEISLFKKIKTEDGKEEKKSIGKKDGFGTWSIGDFGFELGMDHTLGSDEKPDFKYTGKDFDKAGFQRAFRRNSGEVKPTKLKGGFLQEGKQTGVVDDESIKAREPDESNTPLGPFELVTDFEMNGTPHQLFLTVSGTEGAPKARIDMASEREELIRKAQEEIELLENAKNSSWMQVSGGLSEDQERKIDLEIRRLRRVIERAQSVQASVQANTADPETPDDISAPGLEPLAEEIEDLGEQFGINDLGTDTAAAPGTATPDAPTDQPPPGVDVELIMPPQKAVYVGLYRRMVAAGQLQHSVDREERDTDQQGEWDTQIEGSMPRETFCHGRGLGLNEVDIYRPYWSVNYLDASRRSRKKPRDKGGDIPRMQVDHVIEWQVRPLAGAPWLDQTWNYELLDASSNGSSGPKMKNNIIKAREDLVTKTGDASWRTKDITFTKVVIEGSGDAERWSYEQIEDGDHLDAYKILTGEVVDPKKEKDC